MEYTLAVEAVAAFQVAAAVAASLAGVAVADWSVVAVLAAQVVDHYRQDRDLPEAEALLAHQCRVDLSVPKDH